MMPLVSAVITTHNRKDLLIKAVDSALNQTYSNMEVIVVDDKSTDGTRELMEDYARKHPINYIYNENGGGGNVARNTGIRAAKGEYIAFLDDDDEWMPEKTEKQVACMLNDPGVGLVGCHKLYEFNMKETQAQTRQIPSGDLSQKAFTMMLFTSSCILVNKDILIQVGMFDEKLGFWQDTELIIRLCQVTKVGVVKEPLILYRIIEQDKSRLSNKMAGWEEAVKYINEKHKVLIDALPEDYKKAREKMIVTDAINRCEKCHDKEREKLYLKRNLQLEPSLGNLIKYIINSNSIRRFVGLEPKKKSV